MRLRWILPALLGGSLGAACTAGHESPNCGYAGVAVAYTDRADLGMACAELAKTVAYFRKIGFEFEPRFSLTFAEPGKGKSVEGIVVHGYADTRSSKIEISPSSDREPWGLPWDSRMAASFLDHELAHIAVWQILGRDAERLPREWHEFIAYAVQLDLMGPDLRAAVLAKLADVRAFDELYAVNEFTYGMNPDGFAVAAYLTYRKQGAETFVRQLLRREFIPPPFSFPFPVLPEEIPAR